MFTLLLLQGQSSTDVYGNTTLYSSAPAPAPDNSSNHAPENYYLHLHQPSLQQQQHSSQGSVPLNDSCLQLSTCSSIGTLPQFSSSSQLTKTDSHAVLMELFARDQDLVRQATESARLKAESKQQQQQQGLSKHATNTTANQHPMKAPASSGGGGGGGMKNVPTLNSWPHFSSINSLNNLGTMPGVKSITSLSGVDLASKGSMNKMGNLAQVKSMESMGKNDSYAFLEVFFGERSSNNLSSMGGKESRGGKLGGGGDEDNEIGLSLEDECLSQSNRGREYSISGSMSAGAPQSSSSHSASMGGGPDSGNNTMQSGALKRAYDDALAARGLMSVSRSCEKLTDLPAKMQRTLSQEFISKSSHYGGMFDSYSQEDNSATHQDMHQQRQYPGQHPGEPPGSSQGNHRGGMSSNAPDDTDGHVQVPSATVCALCNQINVDTQLRPCGHMFHERCLKPSLQTPTMGPPKCPVDGIPMQSALLAVPCDDVEPSTTTNSATTNANATTNNNASSSSHGNSWMYSSNMLSQGK
jgi:hypothetical protein